MLSSLYGKISQWSSAPVLEVVISLALVFTIAFGIRTKILTDKVASKTSVKSYLTVQPLDGRGFGYSRAAVTELLDALGRGGRNVYAWTEITLDLLYPFVYGLLFAMLLVRLFSPQQAWLLLFPLAGVAFDLLENVTVATLAWTHQQERESGLATAASAFTTTKNVLLLLSLLLVLFGAVRGFSRQAS